MLKFKDKNLAEGYTEYELQKTIEKSRSYYMTHIINSAYF